MTKMNSTESTVREIRLKPAKSMQLNKSCTSFWKDCAVKAVLPNRATARGFTPTFTIKWSKEFRR